MQTKPTKRTQKQYSGCNAGLYNFTMLSTFCMCSYIRMCSRVLSRPTTAAFTKSHCYTEIVSQGCEGARPNSTAQHRQSGNAGSHCFIPFTKLCNIYSLPLCLGLEDEFPLGEELLPTCDKTNRVHHEQAALQGFEARSQR